MILASCRSCRSRSGSIPWAPAAGSRLTIAIVTGGLGPAGRDFELFVSRSANVPSSARETLGLEPSICSNCAWPILSRAASRSHSHSGGPAGLSDKRELAQTLRVGAPNDLLGAVRSLVDDVQTAGSHDVHCIGDVALVKHPCAGGNRHSRCLPRERSDFVLGQPANSGTALMKSSVDWLAAGDVTRSDRTTDCECRLCLGARRATAVWRRFPDAIDEGRGLRRASTRRSASAPMLTRPKHTDANSHPRSNAAWTPDGCG